MILFKGIKKKLEAAGVTKDDLYNEPTLSPNLVELLWLERADTYLQENMTTDVINTLCRLTSCQPRDLLVYVDDAQYRELQYRQNTRRAEQAEQG